MTPKKYPTSNVSPEKKVTDMNDSPLTVANVLQKRGSMSNLILWNISKALEKNPRMDLKSGLRIAQERMERDALNGKAVISQCPEEQHLVCALLAWQQLGHTDADSLFQFLEAEKNKELSRSKINCKNSPKSYVVTPGLIKTQFDSNYLTKDEDSVHIGSYSKGPVVKLPVESKIIMRVDNTPKRQSSSQNPRNSQTEQNTSSKITAACCQDSECAKNLAAMDADTDELRMRAAQLAKREAQRVELLERAEIAWGDLELGYQRRLRLAEEKEEDMNTQIAKVIQERNGHKDHCTELAKKLKEIGDAAEAERVKLKEVEKTVCERACMRLRLSEEAAKGETVLAEEQCKAVQLERDLQFKEEQARRKLLTMDNETESARVLMHEAERALRAELGGLREQIGEVSALLLEVDEMNKKIKVELDELRQEKAEIIEDLDGCKEMCDTKMQGQIDELQNKKKQLEELKDKVLQCQCKLPVDVGVEVKRTASLAALCKCTSDDKLTDACSCTSLRSRLISSLLADLFGGLQAELGAAGLQMPCQLLKCLEDKHNWDRSSVIKSNLRSYFSKLLVGELDIAIATSIENYHAKWAGTSCADEVTMKPSPDEDLSQGWEKRALERRAQKLAEKLAEELFQERADALTERARQIIKSGPPCDCGKPPQSEEQVLQCFVDESSPFTRASDITQLRETPKQWSRTQQDVKQLRLQIEDLKKEFIKKEDLQVMQDYFAKITTKAAEYENTVIKDNQIMQSRNTKKDMKHMKNSNIDEQLRSTNLNKSGTTKKKPLDGSNYSKKYPINEKPTKQPKKYTYNQSYAVNLCMCGPQKPNKILQNAQLNVDTRPFLKQKPSKELITHVASVKQTKPIDIKLQPSYTNELISQIPIESTCGSNCKCFKKMPSNTSIDKLLETLTKWKCHITDPRENLLNDLSCNINNKNSIMVKHSKSILKNKLQTEITNQKLQDKDIEMTTEIPIHYNETAKKNQVLNFNLATNTTSEYMGAINLDKSNECISTCVDTADDDLRRQQESNKNVSNECPIQTINLTSTESHNPVMQEETEQSQAEDYTKVQVLNEHLYGKNKNTTDLNVLANSKSTKTMTPEENEHKSKTKDIFNQTDVITNELNKTQLFPNNFDYYIKFLGVTLADADSNKVTSIKDGCKKSKTHSPSAYKHKENYIVNRKDEQETVKTKLISELKKQLRDYNTFDSFNEMEKCECSTKFEEFQRFIIDIFRDQSKKKNTQQKDEALDSPSLKCTGNHIHNCACCNTYNVDNSKELEVNAFCLLEDHLKEKLKEFKKCSCKSSCISPEEEEKIFSAILKRVKQVISDCANEAKCKTPGMTTDASWRRAYGLLQEYLKIKIKRAQCSTDFNEKKNMVVPNILEKVCNLIENDFQRLKDLCKCKKNDETLTKKDLIEHLLLPHEDFPEKDTTVSFKDTADIISKKLSKRNFVQQIAFVEDISSQVSPNFGMKHKVFDVMAEANYTVVTISRQNSTNSIVITQTISSQVPPALGLESKSCDALEMDNKNEQTSERNILNKKTQSVIYNTCDCNYKQDKPASRMFKNKLLVNKELPKNIYVDTSNKKKIITPYQKKHLTFICHSINRLGVVKSLPNLEIVEYDKNNQDMTHTKTSAELPDLGNTMDWTCKGTLKHGLCLKSVIQTDKTDDGWKQFTVTKDFYQDLSHILKSGHSKKNTDIMKRSRNASPKTSLTFIEKQTCENDCETEMKYNDVVLLLSTETIDTSNQNTNTSPEIITLGTDLESGQSNSLAWFNCPETIKSETKTNLVKFTPFPYDYEAIKESMETRRSELTTDTETTKISPNCNCCQVPICHVKMLIEDIERNIIQSKCTCDSASKICPVHSRKYRR